MVAELYGMCTAPHPAALQIRIIITVMAKPLECDGALSDLVLQAARAAIPPNADSLMQLPPGGELNRPLLPLLIGLLDAASVTAQAVADNAWDGCQPLENELAAELVSAADLIQLYVANATQAPAG